MKSDKRIYIILAVALAVMLVSILSSFFFYRQYLAIRNLVANPSLVAREEAKSIKEIVGKLMILPGDEDPLVVTVMDKENLKDQPFFANASNGDKILIFQNNKLAILYNPSINKIVQVGLFSEAQPSPTLPPPDMTPSATNNPTPGKQASPSAERP